MYKIKRMIKGYRFVGGLLDDEPIREMIKEHGGILRPDGLYDFPGYVDISGQMYISLPRVFGVVKGIFDCSNNQLKSLEGSPESVGVGFWCNNNHLKTLEGSPKSIGGSFLCHTNRLKSLDGCPQSVGGDFICYGNPVQFTEEEVRSRCDVGRWVYV